MEQYFLIWFLLGIFSLILIVITVHAMRKNTAEHDEQRKIIQQEIQDMREKKRCEFLKGLTDCLFQLELPQLEDKKKLEEIAHRLGSVMIEGLNPLLAQRYNPNAIHKDK